MRLGTPTRDNAPALPLTARALGESLLAGDAMFQRIASGARPALVAAALSEGRTCAESLGADFGTDPWTIARRLGVAVVESDAVAGFGSVVVFAEYAGRPPTITLYRRAIERANLAVAAARQRGIVDREDYGPVFLAHELYHHLARTASPPPFSRSYRVKVVQLGRWRWTSRVASLEEIAAGAFAQALLGLRFHPRLIELISVQQDGGEQ